MAKGNNKKGGNKKNSPKKPAAPKVEKVEEKVEEVILPTEEEKANGPGNDVPVEEISEDIPVTPGADLPADLNATDSSDEETVAENDKADEEAQTAVEEAEVDLTPATEPADEPTPEPEPETEPEPQVEVKEEAPVAKEPVAKEDNYKTRLYDEAVELRDRMVKLKTALETNAVPASEVEILTKQYGVMHQLAVILNERLGRI